MVEAELHGYDPPLDGRDSVLVGGFGERCRRLDPLPPRVGSPPDELMSTHYE